MGVDAHLSDLQNRVAAGFFQRFQNTILCSAGIGAEPQQAETPHFHFRRNEGFSPMARHRHCLHLVSGILDTNSYPDFCVIPTFQKSPTVPAVLERKVGITFCPLMGKKPVFLQKSV